MSNNPTTNLSKSVLDPEKLRQISVRGIAVYDDVKSFINLFNRHLHYNLVKDRNVATDHDYFYAAAYAARDHLCSRWIRTLQHYKLKDPKKVYYISLEFYMGRTLTNTLLNLGIQSICDDALYQMGLNLEDIEEVEVDAGLGNGGLGRLAACFLDSMASLGIAGFGYGIRYDYGLFTQKIIDGWQHEEADDWLRCANPWEIARPEYTVPVGFGGYVEVINGKSIWKKDVTILAVPYDTPIPGYRNNVVNTLRLWSAKANNAFEFERFNVGEYVDSVIEKTQAENISKVLYPNDNAFSGKALRLKQEYFLVAASVTDTIRKFKGTNAYKKNLHSRKKLWTDVYSEKVALQLNDTHPSLAIPELMRVLMDEEGISYEDAWRCTKMSCSYTNHTVLPEALERWEVSLLEKVLPRHLQIIYDINARFLEEVKKIYPGNFDMIRDMSIVEESPVKSINMAHLSIVGSHAINGVAEIHSNIIKTKTFKNFYTIWPKKFQNKTNGITPRRWLMLCNPSLSHFITEKIGENWVHNLSDLQKLKAFVNNEQFMSQVQEAKITNKKRLAKYIYENLDITVDPNSLFDIHVKRIHEYKRQLLNIFHAITLYNTILAHPNREFVARTIIMGGKAAPGYITAKLIIKLFNGVAKVVNNNPRTNCILKMVFIENYRVSLAEIVIPAADLSEQISTAGTEASGTGNMKFQLNGSLTIGTLDGANVEMREEMGKENIFIFGMNVNEVEELDKKGYNPMDYYNSNITLRDVIYSIRGGFFSDGDTHVFEPLISSVLYHDRFKLLADYQSYIDMQKQVEKDYVVIYIYNFYIHICYNIKKLITFINQSKWIKMCIYNIASSGKFSSDRTICDYAKDIWNIPVEHLKLPPPYDTPKQEIEDIESAGRISRN
ncbi:hypothetical protein A3Q56_03948 [Intoshia linei]|uniref:Alpha-1,4 glucan phosphorylase n=1 Tax=Intoshia linei TaxID=1819745 RepID=A0A177B2D2_9BILA|nr:hypothetical protein A3Q56_03948 [Intoshia linei]